MHKEEFELLNNLPDNIAMVTKIWGPPVWFFLHCMAMAYPKYINKNNPEHINKKTSMLNFLLNFGSILPCGLCANSYNKFIKQEILNPANYLDSRQLLVYYIYKLHEEVNNKLGVAQCNRPSFKDIINYYKQFMAGMPCTLTTKDEKKTK